MLPDELDTSYDFLCIFDTLVELEGSIDFP